MLLWVGLVVAHAHVAGTPRPGGASEWGRVLPRKLPKEEEKGLGPTNPPTIEVLKAHYEMEAQAARVEAERAATHVELGNHTELYEDRKWQEAYKVAVQKHLDEEARKREIAKQEAAYKQMLKERDETWNQILANQSAAMEQAKLDQQKQYEELERLMYPWMFTPAPNITTTPQPTTTTTPGPTTTRPPWLVYDPAEDAKKEAGGENKGPAPTAAPAGAPLAPGATPAPGTTPTPTTTLSPAQAADTAAEQVLKSIGLALIEPVSFITLPRALEPAPAAPAQASRPRLRRASRPPLAGGGVFALLGRF